MLSRSQCAASSGRSPDVSMITSVAASAGSWRMDSVSIKPVDVGHVGVGQDQPIRRARLLGRTQFGQRVRCAFGQRRFHVPVTQDFVEDSPVRGRIIDDQHAQAVQARGHDHHVVRLVGVRQFQPHGEVEAAALADFTFDPDRPVHQAHQPRGNRQPQSGAAVPASQGAVALLEHPEDRGLLVRGNAGPGIADGEMQHDLSTVQRLAVHLQHTSP